MLWIVFAVMTAAAVGALLLPLWRARALATPRAAYDLEIYRDQLAEVERDQARGLIEAGEAKAARIEIARRALAADAAAKTAAPPEKPVPRRLRAPAIAVATGVVAPLLAFVLYLDLGSPRLPSHDFMAAHIERGQDDSELVAKLEARLKEHPEDPQGWVLLARSYEAMGRAGDAVTAWREALKRAPNPNELASAFAEALVQAADGTVTPEAAGRFKDALTADPLDPRARYYLGLARAQAGESRAALQAWTDLLAVSPPEAPWLPVVHKEIERVAGEAKIDPASITPSPEARKLAAQAKATAPPVAADAGGAAAGMPPGMPPGAAAIQNMSPEQRTAMIRGMVDQLAARLEQNPNDVDGWLRLGRARHVLGEEDKSIAAYAKAAELAPKRLDAQTAYGDALFGQLKPGEALPANFVAVMRHVLDLDPNYGDALWFVGLAEAQAGHRQAAIALWQRLLERIPKDAKERGQIEAQIDKLKAEIK